MCQTLCALSYTSCPEHFALTVPVQTGLTNLKWRCFILEVVLYHSGLRFMEFNAYGGIYVIEYL